jgi:hypothetical protein
MQAIKNQIPKVKRVVNEQIFKTSPNFWGFGTKALFH